MRLRRILLGLLGLVVLAMGATVAISFYHPPMQLMPAPAVFRDGRVQVFGSGPDDPKIRLFYATNRKQQGTPEAPDYARVPGDDLRAGVATIRIGEDGTPWDRIYAWSTGTSDEPRPFLHLDRVEEQAVIAAEGTPTGDAKAWYGAINAALAASRDEDIIVYVHGANTNLERAAGQAAQLHHFTGRDTVVVLFAWPTAENFLRYSRDMITAKQSAPALADVIAALARNTDAEHIDVLTYSAGAVVGSDGLAILGRRLEEQGDTESPLGEVYHAAPDADFRSFVDDMRDYADRAERTTVAVNMNDSALRLSQRVNNGSRAGRPDMRELSAEATEWLLDATKIYALDLLQVRPENIPGLSRFSHTFWYEDPWVSSDVLITLLYHAPADKRGLEQGDASFGAHYWTFGADYEDRLPGVIGGLLASSSAADPTDEGQ
jgi:esterase/lipase superfamily enzyme